MRPQFCRNHLTGLTSCRTLSLILAAEDQNVPPSTATVSKSPKLDFAKSLLETFAINEQANQVLLSQLPDAAWRSAPPTGKGRTIGSIAAHMHQVRLMWLKAADKTGKHPDKLDPDKSTRPQVQASLKASANSIRALLEKALKDPSGKVSNFKPDVVAFIGYLISHDAHHRGQIAMLARQVGHPLPPQTGFALWEWGTLWRGCGFGK
jgi:uncharacterized damage-inducible protein DinB